MAQSPQWPRSVLRSRQEPPQLVRPARQDTWQTPTEQTVPDGQATPQAPQLLMSVCRSRQTPEQVLCPALHDTVHAPDEHTWPAPQPLPPVPRQPFTHFFVAPSQTLPLVALPHCASAVQLAVHAPDCVSQNVRPPPRAALASRPAPPTAKDKPKGKPDPAEEDDDEK